MAKDAEKVAGVSGIDMRQSMILNLKRNKQIFLDKAQSCDNLVTLLEAEGGEIAAKFADEMGRLQNSQGG